MSVSGRIGLEIKLLREKLQLSGKDLAEQVGLSPSQVSRLESGQRRVDAVLLSKIARALEVHPSYFFQDFEEKDPSARLPSSSPASVGEAALLGTPQAHMGRVIRAERRRRHITADELAKKIGKGKSFVQDLESGQAELVSGEVLIKIAKVLRLDAEVLLEAQRAEIRDLRRSLSRLERAHSDRTLGELKLEEPDSTRKGIPVIEAEDGGLPRSFDGARPEGRVVDYVYVPGLRLAQAFAVSWRGDEMVSSQAPSFASGEILVFSGDRASRHREFVWAVLEERSLFRQLFLDPKGLRLQPLNVDYPPLILDREDVKELFVLVARVATI